MRTPTITIIAVLVLPTSPLVAQGGATTAVEARIRAAREIDVSAQAAGVVVACPIERNTLVEKGAVILEIDPTFHRIAVSGAQARVRKAESDLKLASQELDREMHLKRGDSTSEAAIDQLRAAQTSAKAAVDGAQALLDDARERLERCSVKAPESGLVSELWPEAGETVAVGTPIARVLTVQDLVAEAFLSPDEVVRVKRSQEIRVTIDLPEPTTITGRVREVAGAATNRVYRIRVALIKPPPGVLAGFSARILIPGSKR